MVIFTNKIREKGRLSDIQAWRALAALLVLFFHATWRIKFQYGEIPMGGIFSIGFSGVPMFFVLSGFIILFIHYQDIGRPQKLFGFIRKRATRIYPVYIIILLFYYFINNGFNSFYTFFDTSLGWSWKYFNLENFSLIRLTNKPSIVPVAWTLFFEIMFYTLFSTLIVHKKIGVIVMLVWILSILVKAVFPELIPLHLMAEMTKSDVSSVPVYIHIINIYTHYYNLLFFFGMASFLCYQFLLKIQKKELAGAIACTIGVFILIGLSIWLLLTVQLKSDHDWGGFALFYGIAASFLMLSSLSSKIQYFFSSQAFLLLIGEASYSIYLTHAYFGVKTIEVINNSKLHLNCNFIFVLTVFFSLFFGILFHLAIEKPVLKILAKNP